MEHHILKQISTFQILTAISFSCIIVSGDKFSIPIIGLLIVMPYLALTGVASVPGITGIEKIDAGLISLIHLLFLVAIGYLIRCGSKGLNEKKHDVISLLCIALFLTPIYWTIQAAIEHWSITAITSLVFFILIALLTVAGLILRRKNKSG